MPGSGKPYPFGVERHHSFCTRFMEPRWTTGPHWGSASRLSRIFRILIRSPMALTPASSRVFGWGTFRLASCWNRILLSFCVSIWRTCFPQKFFVYFIGPSPLLCSVKVFGSRARSFGSLLPQPGNKTKAIRTCFCFTRKPKGSKEKRKGTTNKPWAWRSSNFSQCIVGYMVIRHVASAGFRDMSAPHGVMSQSYLRYCDIQPTRFLLRPKLPNTKSRRYLS